MIYGCAVYYREASTALNLLGVEDASCDPGKWDKRQVSVWMESHSVSYTHANIELKLILVFVYVCVCFCMCVCVCVCVYMSCHHISVFYLSMV